jgi:hypothetical protein
MMAYEPMGFDPGAEEDDAWYRRMDAAWFRENERRTKVGEPDIGWDEWLGLMEREEEEDDA